MIMKYFKILLLILNHSGTDDYFESSVGYPCARIFRGMSSILILFFYFKSKRVHNQAVFYLKLPKMLENGNYSLYFWKIIDQPIHMPIYPKGTPRSNTRCTLWYILGYTLEQWRIQEDLSVKPAIVFEIPYDFRIMKIYPKKGHESWRKDIRKNRIPLPINENHQPVL